MVVSEEEYESCRSSRPLSSSLSMVTQSSNLTGPACSASLVGLVATVPEARR